MFRTNDCVAAGTLVQLIAGEVPSPGAAPGAAWLKRTGISPPSGKPVTVNTIAGAAGAAAAPPPAAGCCAVTGNAAKIPQTTIARTMFRMALSVDEEDAHYRTGEGAHKRACAKCRNAGRCARTERDRCGQHSLLMSRWWRGLRPGRCTRR